MNEKELQLLLEQQMQKGMQRREQDVELQRALAAKQAEAPVQMDLSSLFDMAQVAGASPQAGKRYKAPDNVNAQDLYAPIAKAEGDLTDDQINYLRTQLAGKAAEKAAGTQARFNEGKDMTAFQYVKGQYDKPLKDINEFNQASGGVKSALETGDVFSVQNALSNFARMGGEKGVLTDQDIARVMPGSLETNVVKVKAWLTGDPTVPMPAEMVEAIRGRIGELEAVAKQKLQSQLEQNDEQFMAAPMKFKQYSSSMSAVGRKALGPSKQESVKTTASSPMPSKAEILKQIQDLKAKKDAK